MADYKKMAMEIAENVGGVENINDVYHCATRLRFTLKNAKADIEALKKTKGVINVLGQGTQLQVVIGNEVDQVYDELTAMLPEGVNTGTVDDPEAAREDGGRWIDKVFNAISGIFAPYLPLLTASGVISGLLTLAANQGWMNTAGGTYSILSAASNAMFNFFPILLSYTASKQFHCNPYIAVVIGATLLHPTFTGLSAAEGALNYMGIPFMMGSYAGSVIPAIAGVGLYSVIEKKLRKALPASIQNLVITLIAMVIVVPLTIIVFGPVGNTISNAIANGLNSILSLSPVVAGIIAGGLCGYMAVFGLQWGVIPIIIYNIANIGYDYFTPMWMMGPYAQVGIALAVFLMAKKDAQLRQVSLTGFLTGLFTGITEPIIYGLLTRFKKLHIPFIVGGAVGGAICGIFRVKVNAFLFAGILNFPGYFGPTFVWYVVAMVAAIGVACLLTFVLGYEDKKA